jgi:hypothetical protein
MWSTPSPKNSQVSLSPAVEGGIGGLAMIGKEQVGVTNCDVRNWLNIATNCNSIAAFVKIIMTMQSRCQDMKLS